MRLSRSVRFDKLNGNEEFYIRSGDGNNRKTFTVRSPQALELLKWLFSLRTPVAREFAIEQAQQLVGISRTHAEEACDTFLSHGVLEENSDPTLEELRDTWSEYGWRDAADFHISSRGLAFIPDSDGGATYKEIYSNLLQEPDYAGGQRPHYSPKETGKKFSQDSEDLDSSLSVGEVYDSARPVNKFIGATPRMTDVLGAIRDGFGVQKLVGGSLGTHQKRPYPSGGARHPLELYVVTRHDSENDYCSYWYDPITHELHLQKENISKRSIDSACFGKGGVVSAEVFLAISCRWARHSWKYRYSRSYRMILLELGHLVQSLNLNLRARGVDVFQCPSMHDSKWTELLALGDGCSEAPLYVLSLGTGGEL